MFRRWCSRLWLGFLGVCTITACVSLALTALARTSGLQDRWLVGEGASSVPRLGYTEDGVVRAGMSMQFTGSSQARQWRWNETGADLTCASVTLSDGQYACERYTLTLSAPFPILTSVSAIFPVFAFLNGPVTRFVRRRAGRCPSCGRGAEDSSPPCPKCDRSEQVTGHARR